MQVVRRLLPIFAWMRWTLAFAFFQLLLNFTLLMACCALRKALSSVLKSCCVVHRMNHPTRWRNGQCPNQRAISPLGVGVAASRSVWIAINDLPQRSADGDVFNLTLPSSGVGGYGTSRFWAGRSLLFPCSARCPAGNGRITSAFSLKRGKSARLAKKFCTPHLNLSAPVAVFVEVSSDSHFSFRLSLPAVVTDCSVQRLIVSFHPAHARFCNASALL